MQEIKDHKLLGRELPVKKIYLHIWLQLLSLPSGVPLELILKKLGPTPKEGHYYGSVSDCASVSFSPQ